MYLASLITVRTMQHVDPSASESSSHGVEVARRSTSQPDEETSVEEVWRRPSGKHKLQLEEKKSQFL